MKKYAILDSRDGEYIFFSNGEVATISEATKKAYENMYESFKDSPLRNIEFVEIGEESDVNK